MADLQSNKMRDMKISKLLFKMSLPAIFSMFVQALYNIVDTMYISQFSPDKGVEALSIVFPLQMISLAVFLGIGVGANAQIAKKLGAGKSEEASDTAKNGIFLAIIGGLLFLILGLIIPRPFISMFTEDPETIKMATIYLTIVMCSSLGFGLQITCEKILQSTGNMKVAMISQLIGAITNIVLDPICIFTFNMGIMGAAVATVAGQVLGMIYVVVQFIIKKQDVSINIFSHFKPSFTVEKKIFRVGLPTMFMNSLNSITITLMNSIVGVYPDGIRLLGIYFKLQSFVFMPVFGLQQGALPILSYNFGYGNKSRFNECRKLASFSSMGIMFVGLLIFQFLPSMFLTMFNVSGDAFNLGITCLRIISISFIPAALNIVTTTSFQSVGSGFNGLMMSFLRQLIFLLPIAFLLSKAGNLSTTWWCYPISEVLTTLIFVPTSFKIINNKFLKRQNSLNTQKGTN